MVDISVDETMEVLSGSDIFLIDSIENPFEWMTSSENRSHGRGRGGGVKSKLEFFFNDNKTREKNLGEKVYHNRDR